MAVNSFILNLRAAVIAIKIGKNWKKPSPAAFKITYQGLLSTPIPEAAIIATIPLIIPAAAKAPKNGWKIPDIKSIKRSKRLPVAPASPSSTSREPTPGTPVSRTAAYTSGTWFPMTT